MCGDAIPPFHVHAGHAFDGFELVERTNAPPLLVARCGCGVVLDVAEASFVTCPECGGSGVACVRCAGAGRVVDHAALRWRTAG